MSEPYGLAPMTLDDLDEVLAIEKASFHTPWSRGAFRYELTQNRVARSLVARGGRRARWAISASGRSATRSTSRTWPCIRAIRRRGAARALLGSVLDDARRKSVELVFLEVRPTNVEALTLYESLGFRVIGRRKGYYFDTGEDALVMEARLAAEPSAAGT